MHASQYGFYVHQQAVYDTLYNQNVVGYRRVFNAEELAKLAHAAGFDADRPERQTVEWAWLHAMTPWSKKDQAAYEKKYGKKDALAYAKRDAKNTALSALRDFIRVSNELYLAHLVAWRRGRNAEARKNRDEALRYLGFAIHCLQDATSKAHADFREFTNDAPHVEVALGPFGPIVKTNDEMNEHLDEEFGYPIPGTKSRYNTAINDATYRAYYYWHNPKLMKNLDLFAGLGIDDNEKHPYQKRYLDARVPIKSMPAFGENWIPNDYTGKRYKYRP